MKFIRINMTDQTVSETDFPREYLGFGGRGLTAALINAEVPAGCDPLGPDNKLVFAGGLVAAGASAVNQYLESDLDARMERTRERPLASDTFPYPGWVPYMGAALILVPSLAALPFNPQLAFFLLAGAAVYVGIYTVWLKRRTPLNIVVGGAAGSGCVFVGDKHTGSVKMAQVTVGWQFGGQAYSQLILLQNADTYKEFTQGEFEFGAGASAVALTYGAQAEAGTKGSSATAGDTKGKGAWKRGMAVFTLAKGGLMYEATIGGQ